VTLFAKQITTIIIQLTQWSSLFWGANWNVSFVFGAQRFIATFTSGRQWFLSWARH